MKKADVKIGGRYYKKVSGNVVVVKIDAARVLGKGWMATNVKTGREIVVKSAASLRGEAKETTA
jgi:hypothetical protein